MFLGWLRLSSNLYGQDLSVKDLPEWRSVLNFADEAQYMIKKIYGEKIEQRWYSGQKS
jgi:hypothetical protein